MVFPSIPAYLDPANWQQPSNHQAGNSSGNPQLQPSQQQQPVPSLQPAQPHACSIRPGSMAERARLANVPMPEAALKCPRCGSSNTKFCYFNNYSLTQPRHFCKTCRRYWTRGGALRSVPVGGGCRRNKRTKAASSKSPVSSDRQSTSGSTSTFSCNSTGPANIAGLTTQIPPLRFLSPLGQLADHYGAAGDLSSNYGGNNSAPLLGTSEMNFQLGPNNLLGYGIVGGVASLLSSGGIDQWRSQQVQQFPSLGGLDSSPSGLYSQFQASTVEPSRFVGETSHQMRPKHPTSMLMTQQAPVKMEENHQELNFSKQLMGIPGNDHQWNSTATAAAWTTDLTGFSSSSARNPS